MRGKSSPPYKYKGSRPIEERTQSNQSNTFILIVFTFLSRYPTFPTSTCCSSLVSMAFEDALAGLPSLGQPYTRLPRRGPSRASVRRIVAVLHGDRSDRSTQEVLQGAPPRVARPSAIVCWPVKGVNIFWRLRWGRKLGNRGRFVKP